MASNKFDVEAATLMVEELRGTFNAGKTRSYEWRVAQLKGIIKMMDDREQEIIEALRLDLGKPEFESAVYEIGMLKSSCARALKELKHWMMPEKVKHVKPTSDKLQYCILAANRSSAHANFAVCTVSQVKSSIVAFPSSAEIVSEPLGAVLIISAWNYPILLSLDPIVGAVAAGNVAVLKPSEIAPASSSLLAKYVPEYLDSSAIRVVEGGVPETTALLDQKWDKIFYTGNGRVGRIVMAAAVKHLTPVVLELGGKSPVIVDSDVNLKVAVKRIIAGKWGLNNGQACISADYIITTKDFVPKLVDSLKHQLEKFYGINPLESKDLSRIVNSNHFDRLTKLLDEEKVSSKIIHGGQSDRAQLKIAPTILLDVPEDSLIMSEEIFGPLLPILTVDRLEESFDFIRSRSKPLAAYLFTNRKKLKDEFVRTISAGGIAINDIALHLVVPSLPYGGVGESGMGSYHGKFSFDVFSHKKSVLYRSFVADAPARYPPYSQGKLRLLKALVVGSVLAVISALIGLPEHFGSKDKSA